MDKGGHCYPGTDRLAVESGLSKRSVLTHLAAAEDGGWISREVCGTGRGWKRHAYTAMRPTGDWGSERAAPRHQQGGEAPAPPQPRRGEPDDTDAVNVVHPNLKENLSDKEMSGFDAKVEVIFERCCTLREERLGKVPGPPLQLTQVRRSRIGARRREGFTVAELEDAVRGFYADTWKDRDKHLDPVHCFKDDETVRKWIAAHRNGTGTRPANVQEAEWLRE